MQHFLLFEKVQDCTDGRVGIVAKVIPINGRLVYQVKFKHSYEMCEAEWLRKLQIK